MTRKVRCWFWLIPVTLLFVLGAASPSSADRVITIKEVTNRVKVRHRPNLEGPSIGSLKRNESAELIEEHPYWYHIKLNNGVPGYVSRAWTRKLSEAEGDGEVIRIGSWKIRGSDHEGVTNYGLIAQIIEANFDVIAIIGITQEIGNRPGYEALRSALDSGWGSLITGSPRPNTMASQAEYYAAFYRKAVVRPCDDWKTLGYYKENEGGQPGVDTRPDNFLREPAFGCFEAPVNTSPMGIDFLFGIYHAHSAESVSGIKDEADHIDDVFAAVQAMRQGERDIILAGTFNLAPEHLQDAIEVRVRTLGQGSILDSNGELTGNLHDHMLILDEYSTIEMIDPPNILDVREAALSNREFYETCGDHLPVIMRLRALGPDDDS